MIQEEGEEEEVVLLLHKNAVSTTVEEKPYRRMYKPIFNIYY